MVAGTQPGPDIAALAYIPGNVAVHRGERLLFSVADSHEAKPRPYSTLLSVGSAVTLVSLAPVSAGITPAHGALTGVGRFGKNELSAVAPHSAIAQR